MRATRHPIPVLQAASGRRSLAALITVAVLTTTSAVIASDPLTWGLSPRLAQWAIGQQPPPLSKKKSGKAAPTAKKDPTIDPVLQRDKTALPAGYKIPPVKLPDLEIVKELPFPTKKVASDPDYNEWRDHLKKFKEYRELLRRGNIRDARADREILRYGIKFRLAQLTQRSILFPSDEEREKVATAEEKRVEGPPTLEKLRDDILKDLHDTNAFNGVFEVRDAFLDVLCEEAPKLLDNNFYVRFSIAEILSNINNRDEDKQKAILEEPGLRAVKALLDLVNDPKQHPLYKLHPVQALARIARHKKCSTDDRFAIIESLLNQTVAAKKLPEWYGMRLAESLGQLGDPNDRTRQPVVIEALVNVLKNDADFSYRVRVEAAHSIGQLPLDGYRKTDEIAVEFLRLATQMAQDFDKDTTKSPRWKLYFVWLYYSFNPSDATERTDKKGLLLQVDSKPVLAGTKTVVSEAYQLFLPLAQNVLGGKGATAIPEQLRKVKTWMDARGKAQPGGGPVANNK